MFFDLLSGRMPEGRVDFLRDGKHSNVGFYSFFGINDAFIFCFVIFKACLFSCKTKIEKLKAG